jgi:hypothetical protein
MVLRRFSAQQGAQISVASAGQKRFAFLASHLGHFGIRLVSQNQRVMGIVTPSRAAFL